MPSLCSRIVLIIVMFKMPFSYPHIPTLQTRLLQTPPEFQQQDIPGQMYQQPPPGLKGQRQKEPTVTRGANPDPRVGCPGSEKQKGTLKGTQSDFKGMRRHLKGSKSKGGKSYVAIISNFPRIVPDNSDVHFY
jgi:hypothetical protein